VTRQRIMLSRVEASLPLSTGRRTPEKINSIRCRVSLGAIRSAISSEIQKHSPIPPQPRNCLNRNTEINDGATQRRRLNTTGT
jgi:hypothetical protein